MSVQAWTYSLVGITFVIYILIAFFSRAKSTSGFYVAGQGVPAFANGMATGADWMSAASFISLAGLISFMGWTGAMYLMGWTGGFVLLAFLLAPYLRKYGKFTTSEFIGDRYYSQTARLVAAVCTIFISFTYVAGQMRGVGVVFSRFLEVPVDVGVVIGMSLVFLYATFGGMRGITYTQVAQYVVLIVAYLIPAAAISWKMTGNPIPQIGFGGTIQEGANAGQFLLETLDHLHRELGLPAYTAAYVPGKRGIVDVFAITLALMVGTAGLPHVLIRFYTVKTARAARWSAVWALLFIALLYTTAPAVAGFARVNLIQSLNGVAYEKAPEWFKSWEVTGLVQFEDKNSDGFIDYEGEASSNELKVDRDIMVLANPEIANLPAWVVALVAAGGLAAALSTAAGLLLVIASAVSHDLGKKMFAPKMSEKRELRTARIAAGAAVLVAGLLGIYPPAYVAEVVAFAFGLAASSFFPVLVLGIFSKRVTKEGAISGMLVGILFTTAYIIYFRFLEPTAGPDEWFLGISPQGIGAVGMVLNFSIAGLVSLVTPAPPRSVQELVEEIRLPREGR